MFFFVRIFLVGFLLLLVFVAGLVLSIRSFGRIRNAVLLTLRLFGLRMFFLFLPRRRLTFRSMRYLLSLVFARILVLFRILLILNRFSCCL